MYPQNGSLRIYNQFPRRYPGGIVEMTEQLPEIQRMGFNAVWTNPLQMVGRHIFHHQVLNMRVSGSLYAMANDRQLNETFFQTAQQTEGETQLQAYTQEARRCQLIPLFDLVLNQIAVDADAPIFTRNRNYFARGADRRWPDTRKIIYNASTVNEILNNIFLPFIRTYIGRYGFMGVRIDAIKHLLNEAIARDALIRLCLEIDRICREANNNIPAVLLGELLPGKNESLERYTEALAQVPLTHLYNGSVWYNFNETGRRNNRQDFGENSNYRNGWNKGNYLLHDIGTCIALIQHNPLRQLGGTIGYIGNHDNHTLLQFAQKGTRNTNDPNILNQRMREVIFGVAFTSDSGYIALAGDEYGCNIQAGDEDNLPFPNENSVRHLVFDHYREPQGWRLHWGAQVYDLRPFIACVNHVLSQLPHAGSEYYCEHVVIDQFETVGIIRRFHPSLTGAMYIAVQLNPNANIRVNAFVANIARIQYPSNATVQINERLFCIFDNAVFCYEFLNGRFQELANEHFQPPQFPPVQQEQRPATEVIEEALPRPGFAP